MNNDKICKNCGKPIDNYFQVCPYCEEKIEDKICKSCGKSIKNEYKICPYCCDKEIENKISDKNGLICLLSAIFLFPLAVHRFYTGRKLTAVILIILSIIIFIFSYYALPVILLLSGSNLIIEINGAIYYRDYYTFVGMIIPIPYFLIMIWQIIDIIMIAIGKFKDAKGKYIKLNS